MCDHAPHAGSTPTECCTPVATEAPPRPRKITIELIAGLPKKELVEKIHYHQRQGEISERALGFYLLDMKRRKMYRPLESTTVWVQKHLPQQQRPDKLILLARRLEKLPAIRAAFDSGEVPWTKIREIARIARADTEQVWLDAARKMTSRQLEAEVAGKKRGDRPGGGLKARRTKEEVKLRLAGRGLAIWEKAIRLVRREKPGLTPDESAVEIAQRVVVAATQGTTARGKPHGLDTVIVLHRWPDRGPAVDTERGRLPVHPEVIEEAIRAGARTIEVQEVEGPGVCSAIPFGKRGKVAPEDRDSAVSPELKEAVVARDGHCVVCGRFDELSPHHLDSHADGGKSDMTRLVTLCLGCQGCVHDGDVVLRVEEDGTVTALDRDGSVIGKPRTAAEVLTEAEEAPLEVIERRALPGAEAVPESAPEDDQPPETPTLDSVKDLPNELTALQWRALEDLIEWSQGRLVFRPDGRALSDLLDLREEAPALPSGESAEGDPDAPASGPGSEPGSFDDFVGQRRAVENLLLAARAAKQRGEPLAHVLLNGQPGMGKTSIGRLLGHECGAGFVEVLSGSITDPHQLLPFLTGLRRGGVLFLDEIHSLPKGCREFLFAALQERAVKVILCEGIRSREVRVRLEPFTLVGATTELGALPRAFRDRFPLQERLDLYGEEELAGVVVKAGARLKRSVTPEASREVARRSKGTPRVAISMLGRARDLAQLAGAAEIGVDHVVQAAKQVGIDELGLGHEDREVLKILIRRGKPIGVRSLAARADIDLETYLEVHEPWLERLGLIERTPEGRIATAKARELYGDRAVR